MLKRKRILFSLSVGVGAVLFASLFLAFNGKGQNRQQPQTARIMRKGPQVANQTPSQPTAKELDDAATPVAEFNDSNPVSSERASKNARWDNHRLVNNQADPGVASVVRDHWEGQSLSDLPTDVSDLIVEGKVTDSAAFLSNDKGDVYSEFTVKVTEVLKAAPGLTIKPGESIAAQRWGGRVKYPDGRIVRYGFVGQGSPMKGGKYLFFLSKSGQGDFNILTGYEVQGNKVVALDGSRINTRGLGSWPFDKHNGEDYDIFRKGVAQAISNPPASQRRRVGP